MRTQIVAPSNAMRYVIYAHLRAPEKWSGQTFAINCSVLGCLSKALKDGDGLT